MLEDWLSTLIINRPRDVWDVYEATNAVWIGRPGSSIIILKGHEIERPARCRWFHQLFPEQRALREEEENEA